jgi:hypothetical protein
MRDEREGRGGWVDPVFPFYFLDLFIKMKYLENYSFKLRTVFTFKILASRSLKVGPMLLDFIKLYFCTC